MDWIIPSFPICLAPVSYLALIWGLVSNMSWLAAARGHAHDDDREVQRHQPSFSWENRQDTNHRIYFGHCINNWSHNYALSIMVVCLY